MSWSHHIRTPDKSSSMDVHHRRIKRNPKTSFLRIFRSPRKTSNSFHDWPGKGSISFISIIANLISLWTHHISTLRDKWEAFLTVSILFIWPSVFSNSLFLIIVVNIHQLYEVMGLTPIFLYMPLLIFLYIHIPPCFIIWFCPFR